MYITKYITVYYGILLWLILLIIIYKISISKKKKKNSLEIIKNIFN